MKEISQQLDILKRGCGEIIEENELAEKLKEKRPLRIKFGADPSAPDIHLGHVVLLDKLRQFGELGHKIIFIIGDFTARIGDPSGRLRTRPVLSKEEIDENSATYQKQIFKILDKKYTEVVYNSEWLEKMKLADVFELLAQYTVSRMLERRDFRERFEKNLDIPMQDFMYPLLQGFDSVHLHADVEVGGTDQKFNLLMGRTVQQRSGQKPQVVMTLPLLKGLDGERKMSKSYGNYIGVEEEPHEMYGKVMSASDELMYEWSEILSFADKEKMRELPPRSAKALLARGIVEFLHSKRDAEKAAERFEKEVVNKETPEDIREFPVSGDKMSVADLAVLAKACSSKTRAKQLILQGGISVSGGVIKDVKEIVEIKDGMILKVGRRTFVKIRKKRG
ncbi:MAG: tyrosine--tRNA ligase [bacterium]